MKISLREEQILFKEAQKIAKSFKVQEGITDIEFGLKIKDGELTEDLSLRFRVIEKLPKEELPKDKCIPKKIGSFYTDVLPSSNDEVQVRTVNQNEIIRPLIGGIQIQSGTHVNSDNNWGTLGCIYNIQGSFYGITNYHVLYGKASPNAVLNYYVGKLPVFQNFTDNNTKIGFASRLFNDKLDFATISLEEHFDYLQSINGIPGLVGSYIIPRIGLRVAKAGAATGLTFGIIDGRSLLDVSEIMIHMDPSYPNPKKILSDFGDSGSIWIVNDGTSIPKPVGLLYKRGLSPRDSHAKSFSSIMASVRQKNRFLGSRFSNAS